LKTDLPRDSFKNCLSIAAQQFIVKKDKKTEITAGFPWFGSWGRDTFISLPGLTLALGDEKTFKAVVDTMVCKMKNGLFPNMGNDENPAFNSVDAPLWFFKCLQEYVLYSGKPAEVWERYSKPMKAILETFRNGADFNIRMHDNGLLYASSHGHALTWMDAVVFGKPVTPRSGYAVEIVHYGTMPYNLVLELARKS